MVNEGMQVEFTGDVSDLEKAANAASASLTKVGKSADGTEKSLANVSNVSNKVSQAAANMAKSAGTLGGSLDRAKASSGTATQSLINLSRVAQDAPFGFIAIANNLNPLLESFQRLKESAGSGGTALKALGTALMGPAGLGLALGVVSSLFLKYGDSIAGFISGNSAAIEKAKQLSEIIAAGKDSYVDAVRNVDTLKEHIRLAKDGFVDKDAVVKEYNETIGKTTGFVKTLDEAEQALNKNAEAYVKFTLLKAAANVALGKAADKAFEAEQTRLQSLEDFKKTIADTRITPGGNIGFGAGTFNAKEFDKETERIKAAQAKRQAAIVQKQVDQQKKLEDIAKSFNDQAAKISKDFGFNFIPKDLEKTKKVKIKVEPEVSFDPVRFVNPNQELQTLKGIQLAVDRSVEGQTIDLTKVPKFHFPVVSFDTSAFIKFLNDAEVLKHAQDLATELSTNLQNIFTQSLAPAFTGIGESLGNALASGMNGFEAVGKSIVGSIGELIEQMGKALIKYGVQKSIIDKIFKGPGALLIPGGFAIAAGIAAVAAGALLKSAFSKAGHFAHGGVVPPGFPNDSFPAFLTSGETIVPAGQTPPAQIGSGVVHTVLAGNWRISGRDLVFIQAQENKQQGSFR